MEMPENWIQKDFLVSEMVDRYPGIEKALQRYAPRQGPYSGASYPDMYARLKTKFDSLILRVEGGVLIEKILLEYKTAKSSRGISIDGNAHERLSYQMMQYLEVATEYPKCSLWLLANGAFARYRNKYHLGFRMQADRLSCFSWFSMTHACTVAEYASAFNGLASWLLGRELESDTDAP